MQKLLPSLLILIGSLLIASADISTPIIGVLTQEVYTGGLISRHFDNKTSYIAASYVKYLEGAGARVVPIWWVNPCGDEVPPEYSEQHQTEAAKFAGQLSNH